ncbi:MAG: copper ion binding protein [Coriobacteriales bacterium]|jgi:copper ion binding protein|nr:copper ion binding protein [Coriobacteriales bacterium]
MSEKTSIGVTGMSCQHCVKAVTEALEQLPGVKKAKVSLDKAEAVVKHDASVTADAMKKAVEEAGFTAQL